MDETARASASLAVIGYASMDFAMTVSHPGTADATSIVTGRLSNPWPAPGGILHIVRAASATTPAMPVHAISWTGPDDVGRQWRVAIETTGASSAGLACTGTTSPCSYLFYAQSGVTQCFFDPGDCHTGSLTPAQSSVLRSVGCVLMNVGPAWANRQVLDEIDDATTLVWAVKRDALAFPADLVGALIARADVISCSAGERDLLIADPPAQRRPGQLRVETLGPHGVDFAWHTADDTHAHGHIDVPRVDDVDTTGAGDTFVGALARQLSLLAGSRDARMIEDAIRSAAHAASAMLAARGRARSDFADPNRIDKKERTQ